VREEHDPRAGHVGVELLDHRTGGLAVASTRVAELLEHDDPRRRLRKGGRPRADESEKENEAESTFHGGKGSTADVAGAASSAGLLYFTIR
jgi:hypothetical protein